MEDIVYSGVYKDLLFAAGLLYASVCIVRFSDWYHDYERERQNLRKNKSDLEKTIDKD